MSNYKFRIYTIKAWDFIGYAKPDGDSYTYALNAEETERLTRSGNSLQDDAPIFYQAMCRLCGNNYKRPQNETYTDKLSDVIFYMDFSGIFDRQGKGTRLTEAQKRAEAMFRPDGIGLNFGKRFYKYIAFERSASMSRESKLSFIREDFYEPLRKFITLGLNIGDCQLSKLYAYNGLMFTTGTRIDDLSIWNSDRIVVVDNPISTVYDAKIITVEDDGTDNAVRKYHRVEKTTDIDVTEFDGEGLISSEYATFIDTEYCGEHIHSSFQIRMPYVKGVVHEVDFKALFAELGVPYVIDIWGNKHPVADIDLILTKSQCKGFGWMTENKTSWHDFLLRCKMLNHALYISGVNQVEPQAFTELNYQFINTLSMKADEFRPRDLPDGWTQSPENDPRHWITKATETAYYNYVANPEYRKQYFLDELERYHENKTDRRLTLARILKKNPLFLNETVYADELQNKADNLIKRYAIGRLQIAGDNRYLSGDLLRFVQKLVSTVAAADDSYMGVVMRLEGECDRNTVAYAPGAAYPQSERYTLLRNPHIARNEEAVVMPMEKVGYLRKKYFSHLHYVVMVDSRTLIPERLGGADFDGDMIKTIADPLLNECVARNYKNNDYDTYNYTNNLPLLKIPAAKPLIRNANDWQARLETVRSTFASRVGQICNAAFNRSIIAYDENSTAEERERCREETETLAILTGLEIDSSKSGVKPDLSEYIGKQHSGKNVFLKYKNLTSEDSSGSWHDDTPRKKLSDYFKKTDWNSVSSNVERLPYLARMLARKTPKIKAKPAPDELLFTFAKKPDWKEKLAPDMTEKVKALISDYKEMLRRISVSRLEPENMKRRSDIERILFARGQEEKVNPDELYRIFMDYTADRIVSLRKAITDEKWHLMNPDARERFLLIWLMPDEFELYGALLSDFRFGGYRILGDLVCDMDDRFKADSIHDYRNIPRKGDSLAKRVMNHAYLLSGTSGDIKRELARACKTYMKEAKLDADVVLRHAIALGERKFAFDVLPDRIEANALKAKAERR